MVSDLTHWTFRGNRSGRKTAVKGYRLTKEGKLVKDQKRLNVSQRLQQAASKRIRIQRGGR
jgi:hypothetical protein